jgi:hypothetical protein
MTRGRCETGAAAQSWARTSGEVRVRASALVVLMLGSAQALMLVGMQGEPISVPVGGIVAALTPSDSTVPPAQATKDQVGERLAAARVGFVANVGQADPSVRYLGQGPGYVFAFGPKGVRISLVKQAKPHSQLSLTLSFQGANPHAETELRGAVNGRVNYLLGARDRWRTGLATYPELVYKDLWPGIDMAFRGSSGKLKYEFRVSPGADPRRIQLAYGGAESLSVSSTGALLIQTKRGMLKDMAPVSYQRLGGRRVTIPTRFAVGGGNAYGYGFAIAGYNRTQPLVIDPALVYSTYLGGSDFDAGLAIAYQGHEAYVTGGTASLDFPVTGDAFQPANAGSQDAFVTRLDVRRAGADALEYSTYLGGSDQDAGLGIAVSGDVAYVTGATFSPDFPVTPDAFQPASGGLSDGFITRIDTRRGTAALEYSSYFGGSFFDRGLGIALEGHDAYITGFTGSPNFPVTPDAFQPANAGPTAPSPAITGDAFVARFDTRRAGADGLEYSSYLGGSSNDSGRGIAVEGSDAYVVGTTGSPNYPVTADAFQPALAGANDVFVTRLDTQRAGAAGLEYSTYLGGSADDFGRGIAIEGADAFVTGDTFSPNFPVTPNAFQPTKAGPPAGPIANDAFVTRLDTGRTGRAGLEYSTFLGGFLPDIGRGIAVEGQDAYVVGTTASPNFPVTPDAVQPAHGGAFQDVFVTRLDTRRAGAAGLEYSTYLGGAAIDDGFGIVVEGQQAYISGGTSSPNFPVTPDAFQPVNRGAQDAFVTWIDTS